MSELPQLRDGGETDIDGRYMARTKSFTRRSRDLPPGLARTWDNHAEDYVVPVKRGDGYTTVAQDFALDLPQIFGRTAPVIVEIGSGTGEQAVHAAVAHPENDYLCFEVWVPGIAKLISKAVDAGVSNLRVIEADAQQAIPLIFTEESVAEVWTFFPDPWRKSRHHKRRLVSDAFAPEIARILKDGGAWRLATDWDNYAWQMRDVIEKATGFDNPYRGQNPDPNDPEPERGGFAPRWDGRLLTHFEQRGIDAGRPAHDLCAIRQRRADSANDPHAS